MRGIMKTKLTDAAIRAIELPDGKNDLLVWDAGLPGLALRVGRQRRAWVYVYRPPGAGAKANPQKIGLGAWPAVTVSAAREAARVEAGRIAKGENPAAARREAKRQETAKVSTVLDKYEASLESRRYANTVSTMSTLRRGLAKFRDRDVATLTRLELVDAIDAVAQEGRPGAAADLRKHLRTLLEWTSNKGLTPFNALAGLRRERATKAQRIETEERGRALSDDELKKLWHAADPEAVLGRYIRALILTGARRAEISRLERSMVGDDCLTIPSTHTKQGRPHEIPIVPALRAILDACPRTTSRLVFPSPLTGREMSGWTQHVAKLRRNSGVDFTLHDLRRTMRSGLSRLSVDHDTAEMALGHQQDDLVRRYDKDDRWKARVDAAEKWAALVESITAEPAPIADNVVRLNSRKARAA
jgi:integrase